MELLPTVTVLLPIRNEAAFIERSLGAVLAQDYPAERLEVLVVDGMSADGTREIVQKMLAGVPSARMLDNPRLLASAALNIGLAEAEGEVIVRMDGHAVMEADYVSQSLRALQQTGADCVGGNIHTMADTTTAQAIALAMASPFGVGNVQFRTVKKRAGWVDTVPFGTYPREVFERMGPFREDVGCNEDDEFNYRLRAAGGRIWLDPKIHSTYWARSTLRGLWRQYFRYGYWKVRVFQKVPGSAQFRHWVPPLFALAVVGGLAAATLAPVLRPVYLAGLALYLLADAAVSVAISQRAGWRHLLRLLAVFPSLHLAYGLGYWAGVFRFGPPWRTRQTENPRQSGPSRAA